MKKLITIVLFLVLTAFTQTNTIYVCMSKGSVAYHSNRNCSGLAHCKSEVKTMSIADAVKMGKRECHICYKN